MNMIEGAMMVNGWRRVVAGLTAMVVVLLALSGCAATRVPVALTTTFSPQAAAVINTAGKARISGQAFVRLNSGKMLRAVGTDVVLIPSTPYADERIQALYGDRKQQRGNIRLPDTDPLYEQYMRRTIATSGGSFSFDNVANGRYYVIAMIHLPSDFMFVQYPILERVEVRGGKSVKLVMRGY